MLSTRIVMGALLAALAGAMLFADQRFAPHYPFLFVTVLLLAGLGTHELLQLLPDRLRPLPALAYLGVMLLNASHWLPATGWWNWGLVHESDSFTGLLHGYVGLVLAAFLVEMARYQ